MRCPECDGETIVTRIQYQDDGDVRRRRCLDCRFAFYTVERVLAADTAQAFQASLFRLMTDGSRDQARRACAERRRED